MVAPGGRRGAVAAVVASALLAAAYAHVDGAWPLGFVALLPWLRSLDATPSTARALLAGWAMAVAFTAAVFWWFGLAMGAYAQVGAAAGVAVLLVAAPLFQPQFVAYALVRHVVGRRHGAMLRAVAAAAAWVATERLLPKLLDDTLGHGLHAAALLRQGADAVGTAGLTVVLLLVNEAVAAAIARRGDGLRAAARPLALAMLPPLLLAGYGAAALAVLPAAAGPPLRLGLVQSNIVDYERLRRERGSHDVVREVLDTHFAMSYDAVERQRADAVLWSETVYPTTFGDPKSDAGAEFDREMLATIDAAGVPFVFGTYERDAAGEYIAAAFVEPGSGLLGFYRKTRVFPLTEHVPDALDRPWLRRWLPWTGHWRPGDGARVFPLRLADGREVPVLPLICLDDVDPALAIAGARLGAQALLTMSNDSWFSHGPHGARLHQAAAAFRSVETRLPQFRVTNNGISALIDRTGAVVAAAGVGERALVVGALPVGEPPRTLIVAWGDWVGLAAAAFLALLGAVHAARRWRSRPGGAASAATTTASPSADVAVLPPAARLAAGVLRTFARAVLLWLAAAVVLGDGLPGNRIEQLRAFAALVLAPELAAWGVLRAFAARASIEAGTLVLARGGRRIALAARDIVAVEPWRVPLPGPGVWLRLASGARWRHGIAVDDPAPLVRALRHAGSAATLPASRLTAFVQARAAARHRLQRPLVKFVVLPLLLALPAFRLHQHIAYGSAFGEYLTFGWRAYVTTFAIWWAEWAVRVMLCAAALRAVVEAGAWLAVLLRPALAVDARRWLERSALAVLYVGLPALLLLRLAA